MNTAYMSSMDELRRARERVAIEKATVERKPLKPLKP